VRRMSTRTRALKAAGVATGVALGAAGVAIGVERTITRRLRHRPDPDAGRLGPLAFDEARRLTSHDGGSIYTVSRGPHGAPTIVFLHGVTIDSRVWVKQFAALPDAGVRVVAFDHRGHGQSVLGASGHSIENLATDVRTVLEGLDLTDVVLVGHSMGGVAVEAFAIHHPGIARSRVRGLVLLSTFARTPLSFLRPFRGAAERVAGWVDLAALMRRPELGTALTRIGFGREPRASHVELTRQMVAACPPETVRNAILPLVGLDLVDRLEEIDRPTLVIGGTADVLAPALESRRIARHIRGARLELIEHAGHHIMLERAAEFDALLLGFSRDLELGQHADPSRAGRSAPGE
ncbi:MAG: alpha/beta hydrolase, partial [Acidimicrobiia bacterium]|nr:alpha/beta hydrolase [Acidimicrobiia bacterium]